MGCGLRQYDAGAERNFLIRLSDCVHAHSAKLVIDMETLTPALIQRCRPVLIKPNFYEFKRLIHQPELTLSELTEAADRLLESGAENILISLGAEGAYLAGSEGGYRLFQQPIEAVNQVGSGDAMLAAFVGKLVKTVQKPKRWLGRSCRKQRCDDSRRCQVGTN
ncbi:MAG: PfkB family carbohydrate kinase [Holdemania massiliensis]